MSKLADDLKEINTRLHSGDGAGQLIVARMTGTLEKDYPGIESFNKWAHKYIGSIMRKAKFHFAGADYWPDAEQALNQTEEHIRKPVVEFLLSCVGLAVAVGARSVTEVDWEELSNNEEFQQEVSDWTKRLSEEKEVLGLIANELGKALQFFVMSSNFTNATNQETAHVWDMWNSAVGANCIGCYTMGIEAGKKWHEEEVLAGIEMMTEFNPES